MAEGGATPKPGQVQIDVGKLNSESMEEAGEALVGLFAETDAGADGGDGEEIQQEGATGAQPADTEQGEIPAIGDTESGQSEQEEIPAIEPPVSWTAEDKQLFTQLPPALQQTVLRRESERDRLTSTQAQRVTEQTRQLETERQAVAQVRTQQQQLLQGLILQLYPELERFSKVDWDALARERPAEWAQQRQAFDGLQMRIGMAGQRLQQIQQEQQVEQEKQAQGRLREEYDKLIVRVPEFADRAKFAAFGSDLARYLPEFTAQEISGVSDHRQLLLARDAMLYRKAIALRAQAQGRRAPANVQQRPQLRPAPRRGNAGEETQSRQLKGLHDNLRNSGRLDDAAALLAATGIFGKA